MIDNTTAKKLYAQIDIESQILNASPYQLVQILYQEALKSLKRVIIFMQQNNFEQKHDAITKAIAIIRDGLNSGINVDKGGEIAKNMLRLYDYMLRELMLAQFHNDVDKIQFLIELLTMLSDTWDQLKDLAKETV